MEFPGFNHQSESFILLINVEMLTAVGILTFLQDNALLSNVEHGKSFITSGPGHRLRSTFTLERIEHI